MLVDPWRRGDPELVSAYGDLLYRGASLSARPIDVTTAEQAAALRARHRLRMPHAPPIAAALTADREAFLTNDATHQRVTEARILVRNDRKV